MIIGGSSKEENRKKRAFERWTNKMKTTMSMHVLSPIPSGST